MNYQNDQSMNDAAQRSACYRLLAAAFSYTGAPDSAFGISGASYNEAFDPAVNMQACSLRERAHLAHDPSALFEELTRFYEFFGLARSTDAELPDHLSVELEFMHYLTHLESRCQPDSAATQSLRRAQHDFLTRHVSRLVQAVRQKLTTTHPGCIGLVDTCSEFIHQEVVVTASETA